MTTARRRLIIAELYHQFTDSQRRVAQALDLPRSSLRYTPVVREEREALGRRIKQLAGEHPRYGYRRIREMLRREGWSVDPSAVQHHMSGNM